MMGWIPTLEEHLKSLLETPGFFRISDSHQDVSTYMYDAETSPTPPSTASSPGPSDSTSSSPGPSDSTPLNIVVAIY